MCNRRPSSTSSARRTPGCGVAISILAILIHSCGAISRASWNGTTPSCLSLPEYAQKIGPPQCSITPAINPFSTTNKELSEDEIENRLDHYGIFRLIFRSSCRCRVSTNGRTLRGSSKRSRLRAGRSRRRWSAGERGDGRPEGQTSPPNSTAQRAADPCFLGQTGSRQRFAAAGDGRSPEIVREGFGLTVTEAMWKGAAVIGVRNGWHPSSDRGWRQWLPG